MTEAQRDFWEGVRDYARARRCARRVSLDVAADALALEQEIEMRMLADTAHMVAEKPATAGTTQEGP
jgi:hypothetical protein